MKHRFVRRVSALALAGCLLAGSSLPAFAAASAAKEEVIYANLTASGAVTGVYAVNSFSVQAGDTVADHGSYTAVRNMTTSDAVEQSGDTVTVHVTEDGKLYYEGTMDAATALPWVVKLTYTLGRNQPRRAGRQKRCPFHPAAGEPQPGLHRQLF